MSPTIRIATAEDLPDLLRLNAEVHTLHVVAKPKLFKPFDPEAISEVFTQRLSGNESTVWIAQQSEQAVGYLVATIKQRPANAFSPARRWVDLDEIGVAPDQQRQGIARRLIETAVAVTRKAGIDDIDLTVWAFNDVAQQAFQSLGFEPQHIRMTYQQ